MNVRYVVELSDEERVLLLDRVKKGTQKSRATRRAQILLASDRNAPGERLTDEQVSRALSVGTATIFRVRRKFVELGLDAALAETPRPGGQRKLTSEQEITLVAVACSEPPAGRSRWTLRTLAGAIVERTEVDAVSHETVRRRLTEKELKPWQHKMWCIPELDHDFVARMEDVLDLYSEPPDPRRPVVCFDETPIQLIGETRVPVTAKPGREKRYDYEYKRNGTANLFVLIDRHRQWRHVDVTDRRAFADFAEQMRKLVDVHYPDAERIRVVLDNLSTHTPGALYAALPASEARRLLRRLEFHYTPKHGSWLNMAEIEIGAIGKQCLDRRIGDKATLTKEVLACIRHRNETGATIRWMFGVEDARAKFTRAYQSSSL